MTPRATRHLSGQALLGETPFAIRLIGPVASMLDDGALAALIGHELGHWLALGPRANPPSTVLLAWERGATSDICTLCTVASELTADRFSLIAAAGEVEAAVRLELAITTLDSPGALGVRELDYLAQLCERAESGEAQLFVGWYPSSALRMLATWLFWRSDVHKEITGLGPGDLALRDVDTKLRTICDAGLSREGSFDLGSGVIVVAIHQGRFLRPRVVAEVNHTAANEARRWARTHPFRGCIRVWVDQRPADGWPPRREGEEPAFPLR